MAFDYKYVIDPVGPAQNSVMREMFEDIKNYLRNDVILDTGDQTITGDITVVGNPFTVRSAESTTRILIDNTATDGDPILEWQLSGTSIFVMGVDDGDNDTLKVSRGTALGTNDCLTFNSSTGAVAIRGTSTDDSAATGFVGELVQSIITSVSNSGASDVFANVTSVSLTAGEWRITGQVLFDANTGTITGHPNLAISLNSGNTTTDHELGNNRLFAFGATNINSCGVISEWPLKISSTTTVYLKSRQTFSAGQPRHQGSLRAWRVR